MSKQVYVDHIYVLEEDADESCTKGDFPKGTIVAVDHLGDWFKWTRTLFSDNFTAEG